MAQLNEKFGKKSFNIFSLNVRSLASCYDDLCDLLTKASTPFSIVTLQEVWSVSKSYPIPGFHPLQALTRDMNGPLNANCGGGVAIYISSTLDYEPLPSLNTFITGIYESIWVLVSNKSNKSKQKTIIGSVYRPNTPPLASSTKALEYHNQILERIRSDKLLNKCKLFISSDYNLDLKLSHTSEPVTDYLALQASFGLSPLISICAHPTPTSSKIIDHVFCSIPPASTMSGVLLEHLSDHLPVIVSDLTTQVNFKMPDPPTRSFSKTNISTYLKLIKSTNFSISSLTDTASPVDDDVVKGHFDNFFQLITEAAELSFPLKPFKGKKHHSNSPWMSKGLLVSAKTKRVLFLTKLKDPSPQSREAFSTFNKLFNKCKKMAKRRYFLNCFEDAVKYPKKTWNLINQVTGRSKFSSSLPSSFFIPPPPNSPAAAQPSPSSDPLTIANGFNNFFNTVGPDLAANIDQNHFPGNSFSDFMGTKTDESFSFIPVSLKNILDLVKNLKSKSSSGADLLSNTLLKASIHLLAEPLKLLFNLSLETGFVPSQITIAKVIPLHKEGEKSSFNNYRPIAVISTIGKLLEKVIHQQLSDFLNSQDILTSSQFGFRAHHGVEHPLLLFANRVQNSLNNGKHNISVFIDLKKAFDTVNFQVLLRKLEHYGVRGKALKWFKNYLVRSQFVVVGGDVVSSILSMLCGIPQGTVLGPLLFLIFVNDFAFCTLLMSLLFADDCTLQGEGENLPHLILLMNEQLVIAEKWFAANMLTLNIKKKNT